MNPVIPLADPLPQPAPPGLLWALLQLTFLLHLVAMNVALGGCVLALHWRFSRREEGALQRAALLAFFAKALPVAVAATVTLGVAPLLFVQVLYGRLFFTSSILMAWFWLAIVPLVILAYYGAYLLAFGGEALGGRARGVAGLVALLFATVAFLQVQNATRALRPDTFLDAYRADGRGLTLNLGDPTFWPRYLHLVLGAVAVAALGTALYGALRRAQDPPLAAWAVRRGTTVFGVATAANVFAGMLFLLAQPKTVLIRLVGGDAWAMSLLALGILLGIAAAGLALLALGAKDAVRATWAQAGLLAATLVVMVLLRDQVRQIALRDAGFEHPGRVATQWGPLAIFTVLLVVAAVTIAWMVRVFARGRRTAGLLPLFLLAVLTLPACRSQAPAAGAPRHPLRGKVVEVDVANRKVTIAHGDIPGFMPAMTMDFVVLEKDAALLRGLAPGDEVTATLVVPDSRHWLEELVVVRKGIPDPNATPAARIREPRPGDAMPGVALVDQDGKPLRLADYRGKALALTFVFTRCPLPDFCPLMMRNFAAAHAVLVSDAGLAARTHLLTVSFDPQHDTPDVLRAFGRPFQKTPPFTHWTLATGKEDAIRALGGALDLDYVEENRSFTHNLRTAVLDREGRLRRLFRGNEWKPEELVAELRAAAGA
jgi:cytochrome oxidase Cu insertion factor (SCO1/SenC/PrrC family)/Cu/Ag efflux protein CusF